MKKSGEIMSEQEPKAVTPPAGSIPSGGTVGGGTIPSREMPIRPDLFEFFMGSPPMVSRPDRQLPERSKEELSADARRMYAELKEDIQTGYDGSVFAADGVKSILKKIGAGFEVLDPESKRTAEEMQVEFKGYEHKTALAQAKNVMEYITDDRAEDSTYWADRATDLSKQNGLTAVEMMALAGKPGLTDAVAQKELTGVLRKAYLEAAQHYTKNMNERDVNEPVFANNSASLAGRALKGAGVNPDINGDGETTPEEVNKTMSKIKDLPKLEVQEERPSFRPAPATPPETVDPTKIVSNGRDGGRG
jgi:hypothetical protein